MPIDKKIEICNSAEPPAVQFNPGSVEATRKIMFELKEAARNVSLHLSNPKFNESTGELDQERKSKIIEILKQSGSSDNLRLATIHLGWDDAATVIDEQGHWKDTDIANKIARELADIFKVGMQSGRTILIENIGHTEKSREILGTKPEHLAAAKQKIAQLISADLDLPIQEVLTKIGYTFDMGHAVKNNLLEYCSIEDWLRRLGSEIKLIHIHDVLSEDALPDETLPEGDKNRTKRDHKVLGRGIIDWKSFFRLKKQYCPDVSMILELNNDETGAGTINSIAYLKQLE